jgi:hypothetical protein
MQHSSTKELQRKPPIMAESSAEAIIHAAADTIDLTEWVFTLTTSEYQACSKDHIAAAATHAPDGRRMSINVERVGHLFVQHYVEEVAERNRCRLVSVSDSFGPGVFDQDQIHVLWEFSVEPIDEATCRFTNYVRVSAVSGWEEALQKQGVALEEVQQQTLAGLTAHNAEETPLFAKDIENKAIEGRFRAATL